VISTVWLSLVWGMAAWALPLIGKAHPPKRKKWIALLSGFTCALALINVLWEILRTVKIGDWGALEDITDALAVCSLILVLGTLLLNWRMFRGTLGRRPWKHRLSGLYVFCAAMGIYMLCLLPYQLPFTSWLVCSEIGMQLYPQLLFVAFLIGYVTYLQHIPKEKLSWSIPAAAALSSLVQIYLLYGLTDAERIIGLFNKHVSLPLFLTTTISTAVLKFLHWRAQREERSST